jgi:5-methylcytosine-specific restriction endonuclease McrA
LTLIPAPVEEILKIRSSVPDLLSLLSKLTGRRERDLASEIQSHLATRIFFLLLDRAVDSPNYDSLEKRLRTVVEGSSEDVDGLARALAYTVASIESSKLPRTASLNELPYTVRRRLFDAQGNRCGVCGIDFREPPPVWRSHEEGLPTLDHRVAYRLGGEQSSNLWIVCALCNAIKGAAIHVGERGRLWIGNYIFWNWPRAVAFWSLLRDRSCTLAECLADSASTHLRVVRRGDRGVWSLDNCMTVCSNHAAEYRAIDY